MTSKMEKSFVDKYLLDMDKEILESYTTLVNLVRVNTLNAFEKCLLIEVLCRNDQKNLARRIANNMQNERDGYYAYEDRERENKIFDLVLNMNSTTK